MGFIYILMGVLFTYLAVGSAEKGLFDFGTILLMAVAAFDFVTALRIFTLHYKIKKLQQLK
jgi:hypothetical protein